MGWEHVTPLRPARLFAGLEHSRFYFAQSYYIQCRHNDQVITRNEHGVTFDSSFEKENIVGVQFHPEKSHVFGSQLLRNFIENY